MTNNTIDTTCSCKVGRKTNQYNLKDIDSELIDQRQKADASLRELAAYVNQRILAAALTAADVDVTNALYGAVSDEDALTTLYETLASDDTPSERAARVRTRLTQLGADIETVEADWVTHPTVRTHLRDCLDIDTGRTATLTSDDARDTIEWARTRCVNVVAQTFTRLRNADVLSTGPLDITVTVQVTCTACGETYRPSQLLTHSECACTATNDTSDKTQ